MSHSCQTKRPKAKQCCFGENTSMPMMYEHLKVGFTWIAMLSVIYVGDIKVPNKFVVPLTP